MHAIHQKIAKTVFIFVLVLLPVFANAATLSITPSSGTFEVGDRVSVRVMVSGNEAINAVSSEINIPTSIFSVDSVSKSGSILNFWVSEPSSSNGVVKFEGVTLGGFQGNTGTVVTINLRATAVGSGKINFVSGQVLANDGQGTNVTQGTSGASFNIKESTRPKVVPEEVTQEVVVAPTLLSPQIELVSRFGEKAISGTSSYSNSEVLVIFLAESGTKVFILGKTDENGEFLLTVPKTLKRGAYRVSAQVIQKDFTYSPTSNEIIVKVGNIISDIGWDVRIILLLLLLALIYLSYRVYLYIKRSKQIKEEAHEAKEVVIKSFKVLHEDMDNALDSKTNVEERKQVREVIKDLEDAETVITKEIKDIEKL